MKPRWVVVALVVEVLLGCRSGDQGGVDAPRHPESGGSRSLATSSSATQGATGRTSSGGASAIGGTNSGGTGSEAIRDRVPTQDAVELERPRFFDVEKYRPPIAECAEPVARVSFATSHLATQRAIVAETLRLFSEFVQVVGEEPDAAFEVRLFSGVYSPGWPKVPEPRHFVLARCADSLTCARFGAVLATAGEQGFTHGCGPVEALRAGPEWTRVAPPTKAPLAEAACGRARLCTAIELGQTWGCDVFFAEAVTECARADACSDVAACVKSLGARAASRAGPARPHPSHEHPWEEDRSSGLGAF